MAGTFSARESLTRRFPSMLDRYYTIPGFYRGNPDLVPELVWAHTLAHEWSAANLTLTHQASLENRKRTIVSVQDSSSSGSFGPETTLTNLGDAQVASLTHQAVWNLSSRVTLSHGLTLARSNLSTTDSALPLLPSLIDTLGIEGSLSSDPAPWRLHLAIRSQTSAESGMPGQPSPGFALVSLDCQKRITHQIELAARVENLMDRHVEILQGYPLLGRTFSLLLSGQIE
jgi:outer membrane cobalamin receptor